MQRSDSNFARLTDLPDVHLEPAAPGASRRFVHLVLVLGALAGLAVDCSAATPALTPEARRDLRLQPGVVYVRTSVSVSSGSNKFTCSSSGTGFLYRPDGYLITNGHVVESANVKELPSLQKLLSETLQECSGDYIKSEHWTEAQKNAFVNAARVTDRPEIDVVLDNGQTYKGEIKLMSQPIDDGGKDVAIIKIDGQNLPTVPLGRSADVSVGDQITVIGYPGLANISKVSFLVPTVTNGKISALKVDYRGTPVLQSEATINHGNSGGPAFDAQGRVIGIATYGAEEAVGYNFFVPIDTALEFVRQVGAPPQSGAFDAVWGEALDAFTDQHWSNAHTILGSVLEMMPNQQDAVRLRKDAAVRETAESPIERFVETVESANTTVLIGGGLVLVAIVVGGFVLFGISHKSSPKQFSEPPPPQPQPGPAVNRTVVASLGSLYVSSGPTKGKQYSIPKDGLRIGRDPDACTVVLPLETVGREHAWVMPMEDGQVAVIDRGSSNGTYVNSVESARIKKVLLKSGDRILICRDNPIEIVYQRG